MTRRTGRCFYHLDVRADAVHLNGPRAARRLIALFALLCAAVVAAVAVTSQPLVAAAVPALGAGALACRRWPGPAFVAVFILTGFEGTLAAFTPLRAGPAIDLLLASLWIAALWGLAFGGRDRPAYAWPGIALCALYVVITAFQALASSSTVAALYDFRVSTWYMAAFLLVAFAPWPRSIEAKLAKGIVAGGLLVGGYSTYRLIVGVDPREELHALSLSPGVRLQDLGLIGSVGERKELAAWCAATIPFSFAYLLIAPGRWRWAAALSIVLCGVTLFGTHARAAVAATILGLLVLVLLFQLSRAFRGPRLGTTALVVVGALAVGGTGLLLTQGGGSKTYSTIADPSADPSFQERLDTWSAALPVAESHLLGEGLGTQGRSAERYGTTLPLATSPNLDSFYVKVALEQGLPVLLVLVAGLALLFIGLAGRTVRAVDRLDATLGLGACATLAALSVLFITEFNESVTVLTAWLIVGLGVRRFTLPGPRPSA